MPPESKPTQSKPVSTAFQSQPNSPLNVEKGDQVTRQMSRNEGQPAISPSSFSSVADFVAAFQATDKTIADLTGKFVDAADEAKRKQDDIVLHLAFMQSLLSKKGSNHDLVIEARRKGNKIPWWTDYYETYKDRLWESLRTMERRIAEFRKDPSATPTKPGKSGNNKPKHLTQLEHKLLGTAVSAREVIVDLRAGRGEEAIAKLDKNTPTQDRIDEYLERGVMPTHANPDGDAKPRSHQPEPTTAAADELKAALANEPDRDIASKLFTDYLHTGADQFANERIEIVEVKGRVKFTGRDHRIMVGDWLKKQNKSATDTLCKCTGVAEFMARRKMQEWDGEKWSKEHVIFSGDESAYRVITEEAARRLASKAFLTVGL